MCAIPRLRANKMYCSSHVEGGNSVLLPTVQASFDYLVSTLAVERSVSTSFTVIILKFIKVYLKEIEKTFFP